MDEETDIVQDGLIGCFRGLVMNGQVVDLYSYMKFHKADIVKDCSPSCDPSPCKNKAICQENWGIISITLKLYYVILYYNYNLYYIIYDFFIIFLYKAPSHANVSTPGPRVANIVKKVI